MNKRELVAAVAQQSRALSMPPVVSGVYMIFDADGVLLYVGESVNVASRLADHAKRWPDAVDVLIISVPDRRLGDVHMREAVEGALIRKLRPPRNGRNGSRIAARATDDLDPLMLGWVFHGLREDDIAPARSVYKRERLVRMVQRVLDERASKTEVA